MIRELPESEGAVLGVEVVGKVTLEMEKAWIEKIDAVVREHGKVSALVYLHDDAAWGVKAGIEDLKWLMTHMKNMDKVAVVSDSKVWKWLITIDSKFAKLAGIGEKHFETADMAAAWKWLKE